MLGTAVDPTDASTPEELQAAYERVLSETIEGVGRETVAEGTGVARETLAALADGRSTELALDEAAAILAADPARPDADTIAAEARDALLTGMTTAVVDVEALAAYPGDVGRRCFLFLDWWPRDRHGNATLEKDLRQLKDRLGPVDRRIDVAYLPRQGELVFARAVGSS